MVVTDMAGNLVTILDAGDEAADMAISPDSRALYVALNGKNKVSAISTATLQ